MRRRLVGRRLAGVFALATLATLGTAGCAGTAPRPTATPAAKAPGAPVAAALASWWDSSHLPLPAAPLLTHEGLLDAVGRIVADAPDLFRLEEIGRSVRGRPIVQVTVGRGPRRVMLWSQMHGDEPTATVALVDLLAFVAARRGTPDVERWLDRLTLHVVPMLNPDGAERHERRNAQGLDINRDALLLQSPEGRALKSLRDRTDAVVGFNLHNQGWRTSVGAPPRPATISLLSVAFDETGTETGGRRLTKQLCAVIRDALEPYVPGQIGRYDETFEVRAFGDNLTKWGTPIVLVETGPVAGPDPDSTLVKLNFVGVATALDALASGQAASADPRRYESLPVNDDRLLHTLIRNATIVPGTGVAPFTGDVGVSAQRVVRTVEGERRLVTLARIEDLGDLRTLGALETVDATGLTLAPAFTTDARPGDVVTLPEWEPLPPHPVIAVGQPARFFLMQPHTPGGSYRIVRVISIGEAPTRQGESIR